jgi:hypothetical protein
MLRLYLPFKERGKGFREGAKPPLLLSLPLPLAREGGKGDSLINHFYIIF